MFPAVVQLNLFIGGIDMKATYIVSEGLLKVTAVLPSGTTKTKVFILDVLLNKCVSFHDLEYLFEDTDGKEYYYHL